MNFAPHHARHADGSPHDVLLPGEFASDESRQEYERILAVLRTNDGVMPDANGCKCVQMSARSSGIDQARVAEVMKQNERQRTPALW